MVSRPNQLDKGGGGIWREAGPTNRQAATGNWRLVKKGIRTQLEGKNNSTGPGPGAAASFVRSTER